MVVVVGRQVAGSEGRVVFELEREEKVEEAEIL